MLQKIEIKNFGPIRHLRWSPLGKINLVIGGNGQGKTFLLKSMYSLMKTIEAYKRGDDQRSAAEILADKLYWTFQAEKIGDLVSKGADAPLSFAACIADRDFHYSFGKDTSKQIASLENHAQPRASNSLFLPAKEVLSLYGIILRSRDEDKVFGFDDTYVDLARAISQATKGGKNYADFARSRNSLEDIIEGRVEFDDHSNRWQFRSRSKHRFQIGVTAEGVKKIAILDTLLGNKYLDRNSILFIDEPECALHPSAVSKFLEILAVLAEFGIQIVMASHSYFVIKKLALIAEEKNLSIPVISAVDGQWVSSDLLNGMPDNPIIDESVRLYEEEIKLALP